MFFCSCGIVLVVRPQKLLEYNQADKSKLIQLTLEKQAYADSILAILNSCLPKNKLCIENAANIPNPILSISLGYAKESIMEETLIQEELDDTLEFLQSKRATASRWQHTRSIKNPYVFGFFKWVSADERRATNPDLKRLVSSYDNREEEDNRAAETPSPGRGKAH